MRAVLLALAILASSPTLALEARMKVEIDRPARPLVVGETNLPDGTEMLITIRRSDRRMMGQGKATVIRGRFQAGRFSLQGADYLAGAYTVEAYAPATQEDPRVKRALGAGNEKLSGPLVKDDGYGKAVQQIASFEVR